MFLGPKCIKPWKSVLLHCSIADNDKQFNCDCELNFELWTMNYGVLESGCCIFPSFFATFLSYYISLFFFISRAVKKSKKNDKLNKAKESDKADKLAG